MLEASIETKESYDFENKDLCVYACYEDGQPLKMIIKEGENV